MKVVAERGERGAVLIVDDSMTSRATTERLVEREGFLAVSAKDGYDALSVLRRTPDVACIVSDLNMPRMDGMEFVRIASRLVDSTVPLVLLTVETSERVHRAALGAGAAGVLSKPLDESVFRKLLSGAAEQPSEERSLGDATSSDLNLALLQAIPDIIIRVGEDGVYREVKTPLHSAMNYPKELFLGEGLLNGPLPSDVGELLFAAVKVSIRDGAFAREEFLLPGPVPRYFEARCSPTRLGEAVLILRDITAQTRSRIALETEKSRALVDLEAKREFIAHMNHEVRNPLGAILGFAELLEGESMSEEAMTYVESISLAGRQLHEAVDQVLDLSKLEAGKLELLREPTDLRQLVEEVAAICRGNAVRKGLQLLSEVAEDIPESIDTDSTRLRQVITNLVGNAIKFTTEGKVKVRVVRGEHEVTLAVEDTGVGISPEGVESVLDPYVQEMPGTTDLARGTGLGLNISKRLIQCLGGQLQIQSVLGEGSSFSFALPIREDGGAASREPNTAGVAAQEV